MRKQVGLFSVVVALFISASVQAGPAKVKEVAPAAATAIQATPLLPLGLGPIRLGMTKEAFDALPREGEVTLSSKLVEDKARTRPDIEELWFNALLRSPLTKKPSKVTLAFSMGVLTFLSLDLDASGLDEAESRLKAKYGAPKVTVKDSEEQCSHRNGANLKLSSETRRANWDDTAIDGVPISIELYSKVCGLGDSRSTRLETYSLYFSRSSFKPQEILKPSVF